MNKVVSALGTFFLLARCVRGHADLPISRPTAPLPWGDINILHTTDIHGWLAGHKKATPPEPNYSGDLGMFSSFVTHMKAEAKRRNVDLLLVDSGDLHDGNGITDGFQPGGVNGHEALKIFSQLPYDVLAIGNHEIYKYNVAHDVHKNFAPNWNGRYLTSNVNITIQHGDSGRKSVPLGDQYAKFKTRLGRSVTALGILFNFTGNSVNTTVQPPSEMIKEPWFKEVIADEPDFFLLVGHMPVQMSNWPVVFSAIRAIHPGTPILIFGGHAHIRDCIQLDDRSMAMASGRYMETIGWMSLKLGEDGDVSISRRYLDANLVTYTYHTEKSEEEFHTARGQSITADVQSLSDRFNLSYSFGISPGDYFKDRVPASSSQSLLQLFISQVLPTALSFSNSRAAMPRMIVANSGALRFDVFKGPFTRNDQFIVSPFTNTFEYLPNISSSVTNRIVDELNRSGLPAFQKRGGALDDTEALTLMNQGDPTAVYDKWMREQWESWNFEQSYGTELTLGYVTKDACPGEGDDVPHSPVPIYPSPPFIGSVPAPSDAADLIFVSFIRHSVLEMVNVLNEGGSRSNFTDADVRKYNHLLLNEIWGVFASVQWN